MAKPGTPADVEALDRLEDKVKLLVALVGRMRSEQAQTAGALQRLSRELDAAKAQLKDAAGASDELAALREERDVVRSRLARLLAQVDELNL